MSKPLNISVLGAGSWGTALAKLLAEKGHNVRLWANEPEVAEGINKSHRNPIYLREFELPKNIQATNDLKDSLKDVDIVVSVIPSHALRSVMTQAKKFVPAEAVIVSCTKGLEILTGKMVSDILFETLSHIEKRRFTFLSGPSFAVEVAKGLPTTVVIAGIDLKITTIVQDAFRTKHFLTFTHNDIVGTELGGAIKNVIAIATGISDGLGFGCNSRAALITRGLYEMIKIGKALGANPLTFTGLAGMGDMILTCTSSDSRNYRLGYQIGQGKKLELILGETKMVAEGIKTAKAIFKITSDLKINAPICTEMYNILYNNKSPLDAANDLTNMELHEELRNILQ